MAHNKKLIKAVLIILIFFESFCPSGCNSQKFPNGSVKIFFCGQYLADSNSEQLDVIKEFEKQSGIKVLSNQTFDSNEQLYAKLKYGKNDFDVVLPSDYMVFRLIQENMLQKIDKSKLKNYFEIDPIFKGNHLGYDPTDEFSIPYTWGRTGIVYNVNLIEQLTKQKAENFVKGFDCLFDEKLKNEILMFSNSKDSFAIAQKALKNSINTTNLNEIRAAAELLKKQKKLVQIYGVDEMTDKMINNEAAITPAFSGDAINMMKENKNLKFFVPKNSIVYVDSMCILKNSKNLENAHKFIDFMCNAKIAAQNCAYSCFSTTLKGAAELLKSHNNFYDLESNSNFDLNNQIKNYEVQKFLGEETEQLLANLWEQILI